MMMYRGHEKGVKGMKTQKEAVANHLKNHKNGITSKDAFERYGITRLSAIIFDLRRDGWAISTISESMKNRYGHTTVYARYKVNADV